MLSATDQPAKDEEDRKKVKDDTIVMDHDIKMTHLWLWNIDKKDEKRLTEGNFTVSDPQWSPDGTRITYTTRPTPKADDGSLSDVWIMTIAGGEKKKLEQNSPGRAIRRAGRRMENGSLIREALTKRQAFRPAICI